MKKFIALFLSLLLILPAAALAANLPDLDGLSFDELVTLREKVSLAIMSSPEWKEVTIPVGIYTVGADIPAGAYHVIIDPQNELTGFVIIHDSDGNIIESYCVGSLYDLYEIGKIELDEGQKLEIEDIPATFSPYTGLGF